MLVARARIDVVTRPIPRSIARVPSATRSSAFVPSITQSIALVASIVVVTASIGCVTPNPHAQIPRAPTNDAPYDERAAYYKAYALDSRESDHLFLHNGTRVYWPEDLLPAVDDASPAAMAIRDHVAARSKVEQYNWLGAASTYAAAGGLILLPVSVTPLFLSKDIAGANAPLTENQATNVMLGSLAVSGVLFGAGVVGVFVDWALTGHDSDVAGESADRAARTYPQALSDRLGVGVDADGRIVDHGAMPSVSPPAAAKSQPL